MFEEHSVFDEIRNRFDRIDEEEAARTSDDDWDIVSIGAWWASMSRYSKYVKIHNSLNSKILFFISYFLALHAYLEL